MTGEAMTGEPLLAVRGLTVNYGRGRRPQADAVSDVSLDVARQETVALVGESGSGKSTIGNVVLGLTAPTAGQVTYAGENLGTVSARRRRELTREIQPIFQDPYGSLNPARTVRQTLVEPLLAHGRARSAAGEIAAALDRVGLPADAADRYPEEFSGGQRQRIAIARALIVGPSLIVCDEPTSALDLSIQAQVLNLLRGLQRESGISYLFITHDLALIRHIADRVVVLYRGQVMETGPAGAICDDPQHPYTQALLAAAPVPDPAEQQRRRAATVARPAAPDDPTGGCPFAPRCPYAVSACRAARPPITAAGDGAVACIRVHEVATMRKEGSHV